LPDNNEIRFEHKEDKYKENNKNAPVVIYIHYNSR